ncbi:WD40 repeat domain-containing protein, partial [Nonomuraea sp. RK-328]|nr:WD40 repeat domain-containing protein [Nonomuraea sp. RK-328]
MMDDDTTGVPLDALVNGDPRQVLERLERAPSAVTAIYRASHHLHQEMRPWARRQILALDAARFGDRELSARILATPVPGEPAAEWRVDWATSALAEPRLRMTIATGPNSVRAVAPIVVGGRPHVVSGDDGGTARLWDLVTGKPAGEPMECGDERWVSAVATLEIDGRPHAVTAGTDEYVRIWDLTTSRQVRTLQAEHDWNTSLTAIATGGHAYVVACHSDDGTDGGLVQGWDLGTGAVLHCPGGEGLAEVATVPIGGRAHAIAGFRDGTLWVWDLATGDLAEGSTSAYDAEVNTVTALAAGGRPRAVVTTRDGTAYLKDPATGEQDGAPLFERSEPVKDVSTVEIDGRPHAVVLDRHGTLAVLDLDTRREVIERLPVGNAGCVAGAVIDGRPHAITGHMDGTVRVWELRPLPADGGLAPGHREMVTSVVTAEIGGRPHVVSGAYEGEVRSWDLATGVPGPALETGGLAAEIAHSTIRIGGRDHVVATSDGTAGVGVWDLTTGRPAGDPFTDETIGPHTGIGAVSALTIDGRPHAVFCTDDGLLRLWDLTTRRRAAEPLLSEEYWEVTAPVEIDGHPHLIATALGGSVHLWDLTSGRPAGEPLTGHSESAAAVATTTIGGRPHAVTGSTDRTVRVWDLTTRTQVGEPIIAHEWGVNAVAVGDIGGRRLIVTGGDDHTVRFWDLFTREQVGGDLNFTWKVFAVAVAPGERIVVAFGHEVVTLSGFAAGSSG